MMFPSVPPVNMLELSQFNVALQRARLFARPIERLVSPFNSLDKAFSCTLDK